jgi:YVTN family beta-propeller protein
MISKSPRPQVLGNLLALILIAAICVFPLARLEAAPDVTTAASTASSDSSNSVTQLTNTIVANTKVGHYPVDGVVTPDNSTLYVSNSKSKGVSVIDTATNTVTTTIAVADFPVSMAITPDGATLFVACSRAISVIDTGKNKVSARIDDLGPRGLAVSPNGKFLYVPNDEGIQIIDVATKKVVKKIHYANSKESATQVLFAPNGDDAWVIFQTKQTQNGNKAGVLGINTKSFATKKYVWGELINGSSAAITPDGSKIYIGTANAIAIFDTATQTIAGSIPINDYEFAVLGFPAVTPDGAYLYVPMLRIILVVDTATGATAGTIPVFEAPFVTITPNGSSAYAGAVFGNPQNFGAVLSVSISEPAQP